MSHLTITHLEGIIDFYQLSQENFDKIVFEFVELLLTIIAQYEVYMNANADHLHEYGGQIDERGILRQLESFLTLVLQFSLTQLEIAAIRCLLAA